MSQRPIKSVAKAVDLLFAFSTDRSRWTPADLADALRLPLSTTYRYLVTFRDRGVLEEDPQHRTYRLSPRFLQLSEALAADLGLVRRARPLMERLAQQTGETVQLVLRSGDFGVCAERVESPHPLLVRPERGRTIPLHAGASMRAILAFLRAQDQRRLLGRPLQRFTEHTITDPRALRAELQKTQELGYAVSLQEIYPGVRAVAAPVLDAEGIAVGSLAIAAPAERLPETLAHRLAGTLMEAARELRHASGGVAAPNGVRQPWAARGAANRIHATARAAKPARGARFHR